MKKRQFYRFKIWWHQRLWHIVQAYPYRILRLAAFWGMRQKRIFRVHETAERNLKARFLDYLFVIADLLFIFDLYELIAGFSKPNIRSLTVDERRVAYSVFKEHINYDLVLLDEKARIATRKMGIAYVSANTINSWGGMSHSLMIHELVHVWQYQRFGAVLIPRALRAQREEGYNYGGITQLLAEPDFFNYNPEQQGDIIADYYRLMNGKQPYWGDAKSKEVSIYRNIVMNAFND
ncbi:MAG: hypothetical protein RL329_2003 [Bacteroidota bacterium]|jgi:hypothetical protein